MNTFEQIKKRFVEASERKANWIELYRDCLKYVAPEREQFIYKQPGSKNRREPLVICDSTATVALQKFISNLQSSLVPPMKRWTKLVPGENVPEEIVDKAKENLEFITNIMFSSIHNSNFDTQIAETFSDLAVGTGAMLCVKGESRETPLRFISVPLHELYLEEGPLGTINTVFRQHEMELRNVMGTWDDAKPNKDLQELIDKEPSKKESFIECTYPAEIVVTRMQQGEDGKTTRSTEKVQGYKYVVTHESTKTIIVEREQESSPWVVFRWSVAPGEIYGRGPALFALPDIKSLNKTKELILKRASIDAAGMYTVEEDGVMNPETVQFGPGSLIPVMKNPGGMGSPTMSPLPIPGGFDVSQMVINDLRTSINQIMFADPLGPIDLPVKTATEVSIRQQELAKRIGSSFGRLQYELVTPLINRILYILNEWELLPTLGDAIRVDGNLVGVKHESPLAAAQDQEDLMAIQQFIQFIAGTFGPQMTMALMNPDKVIQHMAKYLNIPADIQLNTEQLQAIKQKLADMGQMADQSMQMQAAQGQPIK